MFTSGIVDSSSCNCPAKASSASMVETIDTIER